MYSPAWEVSCVYLASGCHRAGRATSGIVRVLSFMVLGLPGGGVDTGSDIAPCTVVKRLLLRRRSLRHAKTRGMCTTYLTPEKISIRVLVKVRSKLKGKEVSVANHRVHIHNWTYEVVGEGRELFDPADCDILDTLILTLLEQGMVDLSYNDVSSAL